MTQRNRLPQGGRVDRGRRLDFTFNGKPYTGFHGDTLASALLANGVRLVGRSFKYHRPRGIVGSGVEEPNALVQLGTGAQTLPNYVATQIELYDGLEAESVNCWPSVRFDLRAVNGLISRFLPPGFYYKTFMWPRSFWPLYERQLRKAGGLGVAPTGPDTDRYDKMNAHCDVLVVGSGPAGIAAALEAGRAGARVVLVDEQQELGGSLLASRRTIGTEWAGDWLEAALAELRGMGEVRLLPRSTAFGYYDHNFVAVLERVTDHLGPTAGYAPRQRIWRIRAKQVVLATGAIERPLVFRNNDRPGVMLASAVSTYVHRYGVAPGRRAVVFANNDNAYVTALDLFDAGVDVEAVVDLRPETRGELPRKVAALEIEVLTGSGLVDVHGGKGVEAVDVMRVEGGSAVGEPRRIECDLVAVSGGWNPTLNLHSQSGGQPRFDDALSCFVPGPPAQAERSAGSCNGVFTLGESLAQGTAAGAAAAGDAGFGDGMPSAPAPDANDWPESPYSACWIVPGTKPVTRESKSFVDLQTDTTAADIAVSALEGYEMIEHVKRYTTLGMGTDQGRTGAVNGIGALAEVLGRPISEIGTTTFRQPYTPVTFGAIAGRDLRDLFDPVRKTPIHEWHVRAGAQFEDVGQWKRAWYYPRPGEALHEAVDRECLAVRNAVGVLDASTLGKIDVRGPDAAAFLDRVYINGWTRLGVGRCRYGFMLNEEGMVLDDGVTARLSEKHFLMHTTTSGAATVMAWLERWLQTEWPDLEVYLTSVTDHWATVSINGPRARRVLGRMCGDVDLSADAFPFMSVRTGTVAGVPARIFRISFAGELSFEVNVDAGYGLHVWEAAMEAGEEFDITPYGTEAMHVLRAEKGYVIVGQDTDGSVTPVDLGVGRMVSRRKDFLGRRSLAMEHLVREDRKQLVGLLTEDDQEVLPEGGQIVDDPSARTPVPMLGHVTSSYYSPNLGRSIAMGIVKGGRRREGDLVHVSIGAGRSIPARIASASFYDPKGEKQNVD